MTFPQRIDRAAENQLVAESAPPKLTFLLTGNGMRQTNHTRIMLSDRMDQLSKTAFGIP